MPEYTFRCDHCNNVFSIICSISDYKPNQKCQCGKKADRAYTYDVSTINASIKKSDNELKTLGDLAQRNSDRMSDDEKISLYKKHNSYKDEAYQKELPSGMSRLKKPNKIQWPGGSVKQKRKPKNGK